MTRCVTLLEDAKNTFSHERRTIRFSDALEVEVYPRSIIMSGEDYVYLGISGGVKYLWILFNSSDDTRWGSFNGEIVAQNIERGKLNLKKCSLHHQNALTMRNLFSFTAPTILEPGHSLGLGDRLGLAGPGHIRAVAGTSMKAILAQQSIRELTRTERTPEEVIDAATWAVFQEGYRDGFGADADHLKTEEDIDLMVKAGYTMYTIDPGDHVDNEADICSGAELREKVGAIAWSELEDTLADCEKRHAGRIIKLSDGLTLNPDREEIYRAIAKYGRAILYTYTMYHYLLDAMSGKPFELEMSVDETDAVTTTFEHYFIATELKRLGVKFISLAPRFIGDFEKGIDYKGDLGRFQKEYEKHALISQHMGPYKLSFHSGSDKFSVYHIVGNLRGGYVHIKTAGTSYLVALQTISSKNPDLFRAILDFSRQGFHVNRSTYHISAEIENVPAGTRCSDDQLQALFDDENARQVLHVGFGSVLTEKDSEGNYLFRDRIRDCLKIYEEVHYDNLEQHMKRHIAPFL
ncbi:MAG: hypothetical protein JSV84_09935 [Gemmatimonadota bacterium]|nr:MAG: hypothetical protein JSV84_09935 [Gemmatimonadota bacterium]